MHPSRVEPGPGQESVWDYPRPPAVEAMTQRIRVVFNDVVIADTRQAQRVLETSHPPVYYIPPADIQMQHLISTPRATFCEWKGTASYYTVTVGAQTAENAAWAYAAPVERFAVLKDHIAFYPSRMDACYVDDELVQAQQGDFYGGWITQNIVGPFKGESGSWGW
ncbi:MAG: DUF427 domain-containing protein [Cyanobacteria bacterium P01_F01_bin.4]